MHPADLDDAVGRAARAANRARVLPGDWRAVPVQAWGRWYVVVLHDRPPYPVAAVYRIRTDFRLRRIVRWPPHLPNLARSRVALPSREVERPGLAEGELMTSARYWKPSAQRARCEGSTVAAPTGNWFHPWA